MKLAGVAAKQKRKFKATTDSKHNLPVAPNLLNRQFEVKEPDVNFWTFSNTSCMIITLFF
jgi:putative transposase